MTLAINELNYKPKMVGGAMVGLQATVFKNKLGPALNGIINYETWVPSQATDATNKFLTVYQSRAAAEGVDPLGYYLGTWGYAYLEVLATRDQGTKSIDDDKIADYLRKPHDQDDHGRHQLRQGRQRRVGQVAHAAGAVSRHQAGRRPRCLEGHGYQTVLTPGRTSRPAT